jgi:glycolate oxidase FAD binding subunit
MDLTAFAEEVGESGDVTIVGAATRGGPVQGVRTVRAPTGIDWLRGDEMTVCCGAGTLVAELDEALAAVGQCVAIPPSGTVGGALAVGHSGVRRLGYGPVRDTLLQTDYVSATGEIVKAGGPTVKNVSGFDLCRLLVGSRGTLGFLGDIILRTRPRARFEQWFETDADPFAMLARLYRPTSVLWDGTRTWVLLEGHPDDVAEAADAAALVPTAGPPSLPTGGRWSVSPSELSSLRGSFVAEVGVGVVHHADPPPPVEVDPAVRELNRRIKHNFDPTGRLNPGVDVLQIDGVSAADTSRSKHSDL